MSNPGKFEGEPEYIEYYWDLYLGGFGDDYYNIDSVFISVFEISDSEHRQFPELDGNNVIVLWEDDLGFVYHELDPSSFVLKPFEDDYYQI